MSNYDASIARWQLSDRKPGAIWFVTAGVVRMNGHKKTLPD